MELRKYQHDAVTAIWNYFKSGNKGNPVIAMPTGTGKSLVIGGFLKSVYEKHPHQRIMVLTHVKELIEQNHDKLLKMWPTAPAGIFSTGLNRKDVCRNITFAGIGSVVKKANLFSPVDLVIIDEAHLVSSNEATMYRTFINALKGSNASLKIIGFTATPYRMKDGNIIETGGIFTDLCFDLTSLNEFNNLIEEGYICPLVSKKTDLVLHTDEVRTRGGEFIAKDLQAAVDIESITECAIKESIAFGQNRKSWLVFTVGIDHALHAAEILNAHGITAKAVHSGNKNHKMTNFERDEIISDYKCGKFKAIVNNGILTTGFDHPPIDMIVNLRPTCSSSLWVQMLGRGTRPVYADGYDLLTREGRRDAIRNSSKLDCLVLDFGGNTVRLGPINDPIIPSKKAKRGGTAPIKICKEITENNTICNTIAHTSQRHCVVCGNEFVFEIKISPSACSRDVIRQSEKVLKKPPVIKILKIDKISYGRHTKLCSNPSLVVTYNNGLLHYKEYICLEHSGWALRKAQIWWSSRSTSPIPTTVTEALKHVDSLEKCTHIKVWVNKKYPEILDYCFDDSGFVGNT